MLRCRNVDVGDSTIVIQGAPSHRCAANGVACGSLYRVPMPADPAKAEAEGLPASPEDSVPKTLTTANPISHVGS